MANGQSTPSSGLIGDFFTSYFEPRMARILLLGMISGLPWVLIATSLSLWLKEDGLSRSTIGWAGLIFGVYAINFWWAPLIDRLRIPALTERLGHRKAWIVTLQAVILACLCVLVNAGTIGIACTCHRCRFGDCGMFRQSGHHH